MFAADACGAWLGNAWRGLMAALRAGRRLNETLARNHRAAVPMRLPHPRGAVELSNLFVAPPRTARPVLKGVSLPLAPGESLAVIGAERGREIDACARVARRVAAIVG
jgi:ABC-type protease/lipase transport system fused ATPase/permease subunit